MGAMPDEPQLPPSAPDLGALFGMAMDLQQQVAAAQQEAASQLVEGQAGGGAVRIGVTGGFEFRSVTIAPDVLDGADVEMLQDLVLAALHDAAARVQDLQAAADPLGAVGLDLGSVLGGFAGALGPAAPGDPDVDGDEGGAGDDGPGTPTG
jgi:DNA-binding YbaB/EbfC family protein